MVEQRITKLTRAAISVLLIGLISAMFNGCYYDNAEDLYPFDTIIVHDTIVFEDTNTVNQWSVDVKPIIVGSCANSACHSSGNSNDRIPLSSHTEMVEGIEQHNLRRKIESGDMPPFGELEQDELNTILDWMDNGYKDN